MRFLLAMTALLLSGAPALACSPAPWQGEAAPTAQQVGDEVLARQPAFLGKIQIVNVVKDDAEATKFDVVVLKQYLGEPVEKLNAVTNETNSCAFSGKAGDQLLVAMNKDVEGNYNLFSLSNYFYGLPASEIETYLDGWKTSGATVPALAATAAPVTETGEMAAPETISPAAATPAPPATMPEEPAQ